MPIYWSKKSMPELRSLSPRTRRILHNVAWFSIPRKKRVLWGLPLVALMIWMPGIDAFWPDLDLLQFTVFLVIPCIAVCIHMVLAISNMPRAQLRKFLYARSGNPYLCFGCGYLLRGNRASAICPECAHPFTPINPSERRKFLRTIANARRKGRKLPPLPIN